MTQIALGTAQFGLPSYGVANTSGCLTIAEANRVLQCARLSGIDTLDTAVAYGQSEAMLGQIGVAGWKVVTKLPALPPTCADVAGWVDAEVRGSLGRLRLDRLHGLLLHCPGDLLGPAGSEYLSALEALKGSGLVDKVGVSIYAPEDLDSLFALRRFDLVQAPISILDQRMIHSGWTRRLACEGVELHARSAFLQGLLLMPEAVRTQRFPCWSHIWQVWSDWLKQTRLTPLRACLAYALSVEGVDRVIVGVDRADHLEEIVQEATADIPSPPKWPEPIDPILLNPRLWNPA
jgi:aryl-alcohol dehydrogenase-like predicted oxidoreductase